MLQNYIAGSERAPYHGVASSRQNANQTQRIMEYENERTLGIGATASPVKSVDDQKETHKPAPFAAGPTSVEPVGIIWIILLLSALASVSVVLLS